MIDADASTGIADFDSTTSSEAETDGPAAPGPRPGLPLRPGAKTLIIGPGGGWDVARALASGSRDITGVEINPIIATTIMRERFPDLSRRLYFRPEVRISSRTGAASCAAAREVRGHQATLVDTWASTAAGAFALSENNLYTTDAFYDYLSHLSDDGMLSFTRWGLDPPRESLRLVSLARAALGQAGRRPIHGATSSWCARPGRTRRLGRADTVLIGRRSRSARRSRTAARRLLTAASHPLYLPDAAINQRFHGPDLRRDPTGFERHYPYDISAGRRQPPVLLLHRAAARIVEFLKPRLPPHADYKVNRAVPLLFGLLIVSLLATRIVLVLPPLLLGSRLPPTRRARFLCYFISIGVGYILIQVALMQKFVLFLGHPTYALTVIIFSMLLSSGLGSYLQPPDLGRRRAAGPRAGVVAVLVALLALRLAAPRSWSRACRWP